jgi:hypothetical protein
MEDDIAENKGINGTVKYRASPPPVDERLHGTYAKRL